MCPEHLRWSRKDPKSNIAYHFNSRLHNGGIQTHMYENEVFTRFLFVEIFSLKDYLETFGSRTKALIHFQKSIFEWKLSRQPLVDFRDFILLEYSRMFRRISGLLKWKISDCTCICVRVAEVWWDNLHTRSPKVK